MSHKRLAKNISIMSIAVLFSRILGLVRDQVMAYFFGGGYLNDAFNVAYNIPNLLRRLFGEGALSTAFVPIYNEIGVKNDKDKQIEFALNVLSILTLFLLFLTLLGIAFAPLIVRLLYPGLSNDTARYATILTRIIFPYLFFIGLSSTFIAILNSHDYFFMTGLSSALLNLGMIACIIIPYQIWGLSAEELIIPAAWGVSLGGLLQTLVNLPYLKKIGYRWKLIVSFASETIKTMWKRFIPAMIGIGIREINLIADALMASYLPIGSITALGYGNRLMQLPLGIFAISAGTAVLPMYSRYVSKGEYQELSDSMRFTTLSLSYVILPITTLILVLAPDFVHILFAHGAFDSLAEQMTSQALVFYSLGLMFYSLNQTLTPIFYATGDTKTPVKLAAAMVGLNILLNLVLMQFIYHRGLALSTSLTAFVNYIILLSLIKKRMPNVRFTGILKNMLKTIALCTILYFFAHWLHQHIPSTGKGGTFLQVSLTSGISLICFYVMGIVIKLSYLKDVSRNLWMRLHRR